jgi:hypothetical protein
MYPFFQQQNPMMMQRPQNGMFMNNAPQINVQHGGGMNAGQMPQAQPQQPQQQGFFENMMSDPTKMKQGMEMMNKGGNAVSDGYDWMSKQMGIGSGMPSTGVSATPGMGTYTGMNAAGSLAPASPAASGTAALSSFAAQALPPVAAYVGIKKGLNALSPGMGDAAGFSLMDLFK